MRILTVVKQVPDSNAVLKVAGDGRGIDAAGVKFVVDPFDEFGIELALQLREKRGDVAEIVALTAGSEKSAESLRIALAMGADVGVHLCDAGFESKDEVFLAAAIAQAVRKDPKGFDLILGGKYNIDLDAGAIGPALAEFLGWPHVGAVQGLDIAVDGKSFVARRRIEGAEEIIEGALPVLLTIEKGLVEPRYPSLPNLMKAKKKPVKVFTAADLNLDAGLEGATQLESIAPPPPRPECKFIDGEPEQMAQELVRVLRGEAKVV